MKRIFLIFLNLTLSYSLLANTLEDRACRAEILLGDFQLQEALAEYSSILDELELTNIPSLQFAYWLHRERGYTAFLLNDMITKLWQISQKESKRKILF